MLITFPDDTEDFVKALCFSEPVERLRGLTRLLQAHADGQHVVVIPPAICRAIEECNRLSEEQRGVAKKVRSKYSELSQLTNILAVHAKVTTAGGAPKLTSGTWTIPFDWIATHGLSQTHLVCEDLYDCQISHEAARDYLWANDLARLELSLDHTAGGGGNTHRIFKAEAIEAKRVSLCIVDSDRSNPSADSPLGQTAQNCLDVTGEGVYELMISEGRELENHLPVRLVDQVRHSWHGDRPSAKQANFDALHPNFWAFADLKTGLRRREADNMAGEDKTYWQACLAALPHSKEHCCTAGCTAKKEEACKHVVFDPMGRTLLKDAVAYLTDATRSSSPKRPREYLPSPNDFFWKELGRKVAAYGISIRLNPSI